MTKAETPGGCGTCATKSWASTFRLRAGGRPDGSSQRRSSDPARGFPLPSAPRSAWGPAPRRSRRPDRAPDPCRGGIPDVRVGKTPTSLITKYRTRYVCVKGVVLRRVVRWVPVDRAGRGISLDRGRIASVRRTRLSGVGGAGTCRGVGPGPRGCRRGRSRSGRGVPRRCRRIRRVRRPGGPEAPGRGWL